MSSSEDTGNGNGDKLGDLLDAVVGLRESVDAEHDARVAQSKLIDEQIKVDKKNTADLLEAEKDRSRKSRNRTYAVIALVVVIGLIGWRDSRVKTDQLRDQATQRVVDLGEARVGSCNQDNVRIDQHNQLVDATVAVRNAVATVQVQIDTILLPTIEPRPEDTVEEAERRREFAQLVAGLKETVDTALITAADSLAPTYVPRRECTLPGIELYLSGAAQMPTTSTSTTTSTSSG